MLKNQPYLCKLPFVSSIIPDICKNEDNIEQEIIDATNEFARRVTEDNGLNAQDRAATITELFSEDLLYLI